MFFHTRRSSRHDVLLLISPLYMTPTPSPAIAVVGSLNVDTLLPVPYLPESGSTVAATTQFCRYGGKGANQALAACRQGAKVRLVGCVGDDPAGLAYLEYLATEGLDVTGVHVAPSVSTGSAYVIVNPAGQNKIITVPGANGLLTGEMVLAQASILDTADVVMCQFETSVESVVAALTRAEENGITTVLNPSPLNTDFPWGKFGIDFLIVNEREAASLFGFFVEGTGDAPHLRSHMVELGIGTLIVTCGSDPTLVFSAQQAFKVPPPRIRAVDTTGAGDAFAGTFAVHWAQSRDLVTAVRKANAAGAIATQRHGAQESIPNREAVNALSPDLLSAEEYAAAEQKAALAGPGASAPSVDSH